MRHGRGGRAFGTERWGKAQYQHNPSGYARGGHNRDSIPVQPFL